MGMKTASETLPAMRASLITKQNRHRNLMENLHDLNDAISAADTVLTKLQGCENEILHYGSKLLMCALSDEKENLSERITTAIEDCVEQDARITTMEKLAA